MKVPQDSMVKFNRKHLALRRDKKWDIDEIGSSMNDRLQYALKVFTNTKAGLQATFNPYTQNDINNARSYLKAQLKSSNDKRLTDGDLIVAVKQILKETAAQPAVDIDQSIPTPTSTSVQPTILPQNKINPIAYINATSTQLNDPFQKMRKTFIEQVKVLIDKTNKIIEQYNDSDNNAVKIGLLKQLETSRKLIEASVPTDILYHCDNYSEEILKKFHTSIQTEMDKLKPTQSTSSPTSQRENFSKILSSMPADNLTMLAMILTAKDFEQSQLTTLYADGKKGKEEFEAFCSKTSISVLSNNNSSIFKIEDGSESFVLKLDNTLGSTRQVETRVRENNAINQHITPVNSDRQVLYQDSYGINQAKTFLVTDLCSGGNLLEQRSREITTGNNDVLIKFAIKYYSQMAGILNDFSTEKIAFPDMKNTNWLIQNEKLIISDVKSLVSTEDGLITWGSIDNDNNNGLVYDPHYLSPEIPNFFTRNPDPLNASAMHSYLLGKNLYQYLTGCNSSQYLQSFEYHDIFKNPIFQSQEGLELQNLILDLTKEAPEDRLSISDAQIRLSLIKARHEARTTLASIQACCPAEFKEQLDKFSSAYSLAINGDRKSIEDIAKIKTELDAINVNPTEYFKKIKIKSEIEVALEKCKTLKVDSNDRHNNEIDRIVDTYTEQMKTAITSDELQAIGLNLNNEMKIEEAKNAAEIALQTANDGLVSHQQELQELKDLQESIEKLIKNVEQEYKLTDTDDSKLRDFITSCNEKVKLTEKTKLVTLNETLTNLSENIPQLNFIKSKITSLENGYHYQGKAKAKLIKAAFLNSTIDERCNITADSKISKALAAHRHSFKSVTAQDTTNPEKTARTFKDFKKQFLDEKKSGQSSDSDKADDARIKSGLQH